MLLNHFLTVCHAQKHTVETIRILGEIKISQRNYARASKPEK